jgi:hypothetical protein
MKKIFALAALSATLFSCNNNDDDNNSAPTEAAFFNFEVGDVWAYKWYQENPSGTFVARTDVDTVKIIGTEVYNGKTYFDFETKTYSAEGTNTGTSHEYQRVDVNGHLVNAQEVVLHPGAYTGFTDEYPYLLNNDTIGYMATQDYAVQDIVVEGETYAANKYEGYYTPNENGGAEGIGYQIFYSPGIGLVLNKCRYLNSEGLKLEYSLIYHN